MGIGAREPLEPRLTEPLHRDAKCHFSVQGVLSAGIAWKTYSKDLKYFIVYLTTGVFAVIEIYFFKMVLQSLIQTCFDVLLTKNSKMSILNKFGCVALFPDFLQN